MKLKKLDPREFDQLADSTRMKAGARAMARAVLVDGSSRIAAAKNFSTSRQRVQLAVAVIERVYMAKTGDSESTDVEPVTIELILPPPLAVAMSSFAKTLSATSNQDLAKLCTQQVEVSIRGATKKLCKDLK